jgi:hypothetical protein
VRALAVAAALSLPVAGCGGSSATTSARIGSQTATANPPTATANPPTATANPPTATTRTQAPSGSATGGGRARKAQQRRRPKTRPSPTPRGELASFEAGLGTAFGTFRRYVYMPYKTGALTGRAITNAGSTARTVYREVTQAKQAAVGGTAVRTVFAPLASLLATLNQLAAKFGRGQVDSADIRTANAEIAAIERASGAAGVKITERAPQSAPAG